MVVLKMKFSDHAIANNNLTELTNPFRNPSEIQEKFLGSLDNKKRSPTGYLVDWQTFMVPFGSPCSPDL
eukprot:m.158637 g.158637  ORF g.158637 m.158637 type:complete len:69 (+) comp31103_c0_seq2:549-755(+)